MAQGPPGNCPQQSVGEQEPEHAGNHVDEGDGERGPPPSGSGRPTRGQDRSLLRYPLLARSP
jgi:hypothetical protein